MVIFLKPCALHQLAGLLRNISVSPEVKISSQSKVARITRDINIATSWIVGIAFQEATFLAEKWKLGNQEEHRKGGGENAGKAGVSRAGQAGGGQSEWLCKSPRPPLRSFMNLYSWGFPAWENFPLQCFINQAYPVNPKHCDLNNNKLASSSPCGSGMGSGLAGQFSYSLWHWLTSVTHPSSRWLAWGSKV